MKPMRKLSRRSFLAAVAGSVVGGGGALGATGAGAFQTSDRDPSDPMGRGRGGSGHTDSDPSDPVGRGRGRSRGGTSGAVTDSDPSDPVGRGRGRYTGQTDRDPSDRPGHGRTIVERRTGITDSDPTDPSGNGRGTGCSDSDPGDPSRRGRNCGSRGTGSGSGSAQGGGAYQTGRRERRYEVCWVDHPSRTNDECNIQTYSEWQTTWSDGRVEYDTAEAMRRRAEMEARGYSARWHRYIVNEWVGQ